MKTTGRRSKNIIDLRDVGQKKAFTARRKADVLVELSIARGKAYNATNDMKHLRRGMELSSRAQSMYDLAGDYERGKGGPGTRKRKRKK